MNAADAIEKSASDRGNVVVIYSSPENDAALESAKRWSGKYDRGDWTIREYRGTTADGRDWCVKARSERE